MALALRTDEPSVITERRTPSTPPQTFRRVMRLPDATALVIGCIIGAGIFRMASPIAGQVQHVGLVLATWLAGGLISLCGAICYAELGAAFPRSGGDYVYLTAAYGRVVGFLFGWTKLFIERTGTIAILGFVCAEYLGYFTGYGAFGVKVAATLAVAVLTAANLFGVRYGASVQNLFTAIKLLALASIVAIGWGSGGARMEWVQPCGRRRLRSRICKRAGSRSSSYSGRTVAGPSRRMWRRRFSGRSGTCRGRSCSASA